METGNKPDAWDADFDLETAPLDPPPGLGWIDWGGDGSTLERPVRAHVLTAMIPVDQPYPAPVAALCELGDPDQTDVDVRREELEITQEYVPDLVRMARDRALNTAMNDTTEVWAPIHALHVLQDLDISAVVEDLIPLFDIQGDWSEQLVPHILGQAGSIAIEPLQRYLNDQTRWVYGRADAITALQEAAEIFPKLRSQVVQIMQNVLEDAANEHEVINSFLIDALVELHVVEALPLIRRAFELDRVDEMVRGDWGTVLADLDIEPDPDDPLIQASAQRWEEQRHSLLDGLRLNLPLLDPASFDELEYDDDEDELGEIQAEPDSALPLLPPPLPAIAPSSKPHAHERKAKQKRKQSSASRKANQQKKKRK